MFCPVCRTEYRDTFSRCAECDSPLVQELQSPAPSRALFNGEPPAVLWRGQDPVAFSAILSALTDSGIPFFESNRRDYTASLSSPVALGFYGLPYRQIFVHRSNLESALQVVTAALRPRPSLELDDEAVPDPTQKTAISADTTTGKDRSAPVSIWHGDDPARAEFLRGLLVDNAIPCWESSGAQNSVKLYVPAEFQARARAIIGPELSRAQTA